jgi:hypothetical protein
MMIDGVTHFLIEYNTTLIIMKHNFVPRNFHCPSISAVTVVEFIQGCNHH